MGTEMTNSTYILSYLPPCGASRAYAGTVEAKNETEAFALGCAFGIFPDGDPEGYQARIIPHPLGFTLRSKCGHMRLSYHPEWSYSQPWVNYWNGSAERHFRDIGHALGYMRQNGYRFDTSGV